MKNLLYYFLIFPLVVTAQSTPSFNPPVNTGTSVLRDFGDTITFEEYESGTIITNQYSANGAIFSGYGQGNYADVFDYGMYSYGKILKSDDWYHPFKLRFVEPEDTSKPRLIRYFSFENAVESEVDYIKAKFYSAEDTLIFVYTSVSWEWPTIDLGSNIAAYVVFDDIGDQTAYIVDNIWFAQDSLATSVHANSSGVEVVLSPNPADEFVSIQLLSEWNSFTLKVFDIAGHLVLETKSSERWLDISSFKNGVYWVQINTEIGTVNRPLIIQH